MKIPLLAGDSGARIGALGALWMIMMDEVRWCVDCRWTIGIRASESISLRKNIQWLMWILRAWTTSDSQNSFWNLTPTKVPSFIKLITVAGHPVHTTSIGSDSLKKHTLPTGFLGMGAKTLTWLPLRRLHSGMYPTRHLVSTTFSRVSPQNGPFHKVCE